MNLYRKFSQTPIDTPAPRHTPAHPGPPSGDARPLVRQVICDGRKHGSRQMSTPQSAPGDSGAEPPNLGRRSIGMPPSAGKPKSRTTPIARGRHISQELSISWTAAWSKVSVPGPIMSASATPPRVHRRRTRGAAQCGRARNGLEHDGLPPPRWPPQKPGGMGTCAARTSRPARRTRPWHRVGLDTPTRRLAWPRNRVPHPATASIRLRGPPVTATTTRAVRLPRKGGRTPVARDHRASAVRPLIG